MAFNARLYADPTPLAFCALRIDGRLPMYVSGDPYEGRLDVVDPVGKVTIVSVDGELPPGAKVDYDATNRQIVVTWPGYSRGPKVIDIANQDFSEGDTGWTKGRGVTITDNPEWGARPEFALPDKTWYAQFHRAGGLSEITSIELVPVTAGTWIEAHFNWQQGQSRRGSVVARPVLEWWMPTADNRPGDYTQRGKVNHSWVAGDLGRENDGQNSPTRGWNVLSVRARAPVDGFVRPSFSFNRQRQLYPAWIDRFWWNHSYTDPDAQDGMNGVDVDYPIAITIRDEKGCRATWRGVISEFYLYFTSQLYPLSVAEGVGLSAAALAGGLESVLTTLGAGSEMAALSVAPIGGALRAPVTSGRAPAESVSLQVAAMGGQLRSPLQAGAAPPEAVEVTVTPRAGELRAALIQGRAPAESVSLAVTPVGGKLA